MRFSPRQTLCALTAVLLAVSAGCADRGPGMMPPPEPLERETYVIGVTDQLQIRVWNNRDLDVKVPVRRDGMISVPLLDDVPAEGLTPEELKEVLTERLQISYKALLYKMKENGLSEGR